MQRPLRDTMATVYGAENLNWLMTGTFAGTILLSIMINQLERKTKITQAIPGFIIGIGTSQMIFYFVLQSPTSGAALAYFVFTGSTSLSLLSIILRSLLLSANHVKNVIAMSSLGALAGPLLTLAITKIAGAIALLPLSGFILFGIALGIHLSKHENHTQFKFIYTNDKVFPLKRMALFTLLYTFIATGFYFFLIKMTTTNLNPEERLTLFACMDITINSLAILLPIVLSNRLLRTPAFIVAPCAALALLSTLGLIPTLAVTILAVATFKLVHLTIQKPAREMLFLSSSLSSPYSTKNFMDTAIYRLGDALGGWFVTILISYELNMAQIALYFLPATILWVFTGVAISKKTKFTT